MNNLKIIIADAIAGIAIALASGAFNSTPFGFTGAAWYGLPIPWTKQSIALPPPYYRGVLQTDYMAFIADVIIWFVVAFIVSMIILRFIRSNNKKR